MHEFGTLASVRRSRPLHILMLTVHQSNRLEELADALAEVCAPPLDRPLAAEEIVVPNQGMARWLSLQLADRLGICTNVEFSLPAALVWELWSSVLPGAPSRNAYSLEAMTWRLFGALGTLSGESSGAVLAYLADGADWRRFDLARRIANSLDQYMVYRPEMLLGWEDGRLTANHPDEPWQADLWRRLVEAGGGRHRARLHQEFLRSISSARDLPERLSVFGLPALPPAIFEALQAVATRADVHVFLVNPCRAYWMEALPDRTIARIAGDQDPAELYLDSGNMLLASLGGQGRDFLSMVLEQGGIQEERFHEPESESILGHLQRDILDLQQPGRDGLARHEVGAVDHSVQVSGSYSRMREVEALQDYLLQCFADNPDLDPSDVRVMVPKIEDYAPVIEAVFGNVPQERRIPYAIADLGARMESPIIDAFVGLLELPDGRFEAPTVLGFLEIEAIREKFDFAEDDLTRATQWVRDAGIRWGIDAADRASRDLPEVAENTWRFGLDRMMLGYAMAGSGREIFADILPVEGIEGTDARVMGQIQTFAAAILGLARALEGKRSLPAWCEQFESLLEDFFAADENSDEIAAIRESVVGLRKQAEESGFTEEISLEVAREALGTQLAAPGAAWAFFSGRITFCTLVPMRSVPARIVCLLGLNDGEFPRADRTPSFDLMAEDYRRGDRARREDDRYLFLEAMLSARDAIYLSHISRSPRDNSELAPSVLLAELEDAIRCGFVVTGTQSAPSIRQEHRLQAFSPRYFSEEGPYFSFREDLATALNERHGPSSGRRFLTEELPEPDAEWRTVSVARLARFFRSPGKFFLQERLGIRLDEAEASVPSTETFVFDALQKWQLRARVVEEEFSGENAGSNPNSNSREISRLMRAAGELPHGAAGPVLVEGVHEDLSGFLLRVVETRPEGPALTRSVDFRIGDFRILGEVEQVHASEYYVVAAGRHAGKGRYTFDQRDLVEVWIRHLVLAASGYSLPTRCLSPDEDLRILEVPDAAGLLADLLEFYWEGLRKPKTFFPRLAPKFFSSQTKDPIKSSRNAFVNDFRKDGEWDRSLAYQLLWPEGAAALDEEFARNSLRVWGPLVESSEKIKKPRKPMKPKGAAS